MRVNGGQGTVELLQAADRHIPEATAGAPGILMSSAQVDLDRMRQGTFSLSYLHDMDFT